MSAEFIAYLLFLIAVGGLVLAAWPSSKEEHALTLIKSRPREAYEWAVSMFGTPAECTEEWANRMIEEAIELAQSCGLSIGQVIRIVNRVYMKPPGEIKNEIGGLVITLDSLCYALSEDPQECGNAELRRVKSIPADYFRKKHAEKVRAGTAMA